jgi:hypothetical protein
VWSRIERHRRPARGPAQAVPAEQLSQITQAARLPKASRQSASREHEAQSPVAAQ